MLKLGALLFKLLGGTGKLLTGPIGWLLGLILEKVVVPLIAKAVHWWMDLKKSKEERRVTAELKKAYQEAKTPEEREDAFRKLLAHTTKP